MCCLILSAYFDRSDSLAITTIAKATITLLEPSQWDIQLYLIKSRAQQYQIWELINPDQLIKPEGEQELDLPDLLDTATTTTTNTFNFQMSIYNAKYKKFNKQRYILANIIYVIQELIKPALLTYIKNELDPYLYTLLRALRIRITPLVRAIKLKLKRQQRSLIKRGSGN